MKAIEAKTTLATVKSVKVATVKPVKVAKASSYRKEV